MNQELKPGEYVGEDFREVWCNAMAEWYWPGKCEGPHPTWQSDPAGNGFITDDCGHTPGFHPGIIYRLTPPPKRTTTIDGKTYMLAEKVAPMLCKQYFYVDGLGVQQATWVASAYDEHRYSTNNVFLTEEDAQAWFDLGVKQRGGV
ncbi:MAG: hypothetical protein KGL39_47250 [Patescibacteria group bacterium]|nr:hypothetical protein [Patescibacteria group bacterium]